MVSCAGWAWRKDFGIKQHLAWPCRFGLLSHSTQVEGLCKHPAVQESNTVYNIQVRIEHEGNVYSITFLNPGFGWSLTLDLLLIL